MSLLFLHIPILLQEFSLGISLESDFSEQREWMRLPKFDFEVGGKNKHVRMFSLEERDIR